MKGIFITEQGKQKLEDELAVLEDKMNAPSIQYSYGFYALYGKRLMLKEILKYAIVLPVEENIKYVKSGDFGDEFDVCYPNGVIIQPKQ